MLIRLLILLCFLTGSLESPLSPPRTVGCGAGGEEHLATVGQEWPCQGAAPRPWGVPAPGVPQEEVTPGSCRGCTAEARCRGGGALFPAKERPSDPVGRAGAGKGRGRPLGTAGTSDSQLTGPVTNVLVEVL